MVAGRDLEDVTNLCSSAARRHTASSRMRSRMDRQDPAREEGAEVRSKSAAKSSAAKSVMSGGRVR